MNEIHDVYMLYHIRPIDDENGTHKLIGVYSTRQLAEEAIARLKDKPGFVSSPECFQIFDQRLDRDGWTEGFITVEEAMQELE